MNNPVCQYLCDGLIVQRKHKQSVFCPILILQGQTWEGILWPVSTLYGLWTLSMDNGQSMENIYCIIIPILAISFWHSIWEQRMAIQKSLLTFQTHLLFLHLVKYTGWGCAMKQVDYQYAAQINNVDRCSWRRRHHECDSSNDLGKLQLFRHEYFTLIDTKLFFL